MSRLAQAFFYETGGAPTDYILKKEKSKQSLQQVQEIKKQKKKKISCKLAAHFSPSLSFISALINAIWHLTQTG